MDFSIPNELIIAVLSMAIGGLAVYKFRKPKASKTVRVGSLAKELTKNKKHIVKALKLDEDKAKKLDQAIGIIGTLEQAFGFMNRFKPIKNAIGEYIDLDVEGVESE